MPRTWSRRAIAAIILGAGAAGAFGQAEETKEWSLFWSESMGIGFLAYGQPLDEQINLPQGITEKLASSLAVSYDFGGLTISIASLTLRADATLSATEALDLRLASPATKAEDYEIVRETARPDSDFPYVERHVKYTLPSGDAEARRVMVVQNGQRLWIIDARGLFEQPAREVTNRIFDSLQMDATGKVRPGSPKPGG